MPSERYVKARKSGTINTFPSKFRSNALVRLGDITAFDKVFTDRLPDTAMQKMLKEAGVECLIADAV